MGRWKKGWPANEAELASCVVAWLKNNGCEVYQEVQCRSGGPVADIVALHGPAIWVIETKKSLSLDVIGQARYWHRYAHYCSVAIPKRKRGDRSLGFGWDVCSCMGLGLMEIESTGEVYERLYPQMRRRALADIMRSRLCDEQKTFAPAGNANGQRWTPWKATCTSVALYVKNNPGTTLKDMLDRVSTHYSSKSSARGALVQWIEAGKVPGVRIERDGRYLRLWPEAI